MDDTLPTRYTCPICGFPGLYQPPFNAAGDGSFEICPCCGLQFGYTCLARSPWSLRQEWLRRGGPWRHPPAPPDWDPIAQLRRAGLHDQPPHYSGWELLQRGDYEAAVEEFSREYARHPGEERLLNLGVAMLSAGQVEAAAAVIEEARPPVPSPGPAWSRWAGTSAWLLGDSDEAVTLWETGLTAALPSRLLSIDLTTLLFFASVADPGCYSRGAIVRHLERFAVSPDVFAPGESALVARFLRGEIDEASFETACRPADGAALAYEVGRYHFRVGVVARKKGDHAGFLSRMRRCAGMQRCESLCEFHLARHETGAFCLVG
jgi:tetratricopeptide (TPR) repeat protein